MLIDRYEYEEIMRNIECQQRANAMFDKAVSAPIKGNTIVYLDNRDVELNADKIEYDANNRTLKAYNSNDSLIACFSFVVGYAKK